MARMVPARMPIRTYNRDFESKSLSKALVIIETCLGKVLCTGN